MTFWQREQQEQRLYQECLVGPSRGRLKSRLPSLPQVPAGPPGTFTQAALIKKSNQHLTNNGIQQAIN